MYPIHLPRSLFLSAFPTKVLHAVLTLVLYAAHFTNYISLDPIIINIPVTEHEAHNYVIFSILPVTSFLGYKYNLLHFVLKYHHSVFYPFGYRPRFTTIQTGKFTCKYLDLNGALYP